MTLHPAIIALITGSFFVSYMLLYSSYFGLQILRKWDINSGSELQLRLERKTYLISMIMAYAFGFQLISLFLFIFTADDLCTLFVGAMCAVGTLNVNQFGYPTLALKVLNFLCAGIWLILNFTDNRARDYPLIKTKYLLLLLVTPLILAETFLQARYFLALEPNVITSCCGSLFSTETGGGASQLISFRSIPMKVVFYCSIALTIGSGLFFYLRGKGGYFFSLMSAAAFFVSIAALITVFSLYFYELPSHRCPFCILQKEYGYVGYPLYIALLGGAVPGLGVGALMPLRTISSLKEVLPRIQRRLVMVSVAFYLFFTAIVTYRMIFSHFIMEGY
ncbi:MAG: hypothetical protein EPN25_06480 [Nitrospirae bacterium]|nr:MAG: hypothetical protein EPN25_06480 [Nitrospirota bacterium]